MVGRAEKAVGLLWMTVALVWGPSRVLVANCAWLLWMMSVWVGVSLEVRFIIGIRFFIVRWCCGEGLVIVSSLRDNGGEVLIRSCPIVLVLSLWVSVMLRVT